MSIKLLVADDSITIQKVIGIIFGGDDYSLTVVDNGKAAIEKAREVCPDVLLIDALMPGMTGYEVSEAVRATPALANKPILILTGSFEPFDEDKARKCGADDFLAKPFESQQIISKVKELAELGMARENAAASSQAPATFETEPEQPAPPAFAPTAETFTEPASVTQPEMPAAVPPSDIWGAFTVEEEPASAPFAEPLPVFESTPVSPSPEFAAEPDVFAIVKEETDSQLVQPAVATGSSEHNTGSQWIPVEEHTFEFEEETVSDLPAAALTEEHGAPVMEASFGDITFEEEVEPPQPISTIAAVSTPVMESATPAFVADEQTFEPFEEPTPAFTPPQDVFEFADEPAAVPEPEPVYSAPDVFTAPEPSIPEAAAPVIAAAPAALTEDQLRAAISSASKEVIERIVWEVVPDLAETLIKEAIRKIREGL